MRQRPLRHLQGQGGYTLVEVIIACALGAILMSALTSVILTSVRAGATANNRVQASNQIRSFQFFAYDDFAHSTLPNPVGCGTAANPCTTQAIVLSGLRASNAPNPVVTQYNVSYTWNSATFVVNRTVGAGTPVGAATNVTDFSWYLSGTGQFRTVVVSMTVTVCTPSLVPCPVGNQSYAQSQSLQFYPRVDP
jgi:prepilin-type N-terminal cleavage/methylation domain-containing protein